MDLKLIAFICVLVSSVVCNEENNKIDQEEDFTIILGDDNFADTIKTNSFFVMFHAPWCGHCKKLKPTWNQLAELINTQDESRVKIAMVDCVDNDATCKANKIEGYPTLRFFKIDTPEPVNYRSPRDLPSLTQFINDQLGTSVAEEEEVEKEEPAVPVPQKGLIELTDKNFNQLTENGLWFIKFYAPWCGHCQRMAPTWTELATSLEYDNTVNVAKIDCTEYRPLCKDFDVKGFPTILWIENGKKIDKYSGPRTVEDFKAYIDKRLETKGGDGEEKPKEEVKTEEADAVLQLSGENFHQVIEKDLTFVSLTAAWCGHCKRLIPTWQQLAEKFVGNEKIKIAKVDCSINENRDLCTEQEVNGYPTIFIYKNGKKISEYNGNRGLEDMFDFVKSHVEDENPRDEL